MGYRQDEFGELRAERPTSRPRLRNVPAPAPSRPWWARLIWIVLGLVWAGSYFQGLRF